MPLITQIHVVTARSSTKQRRELRHALQSKLLLYLRALGALVESENGELAVQFQLPPSNASQLALLTAARGMWEKATAQKEVLLIWRSSLVRIPRVSIRVPPWD